jgi:hypothetical protein
MGYQKANGQYARTIPVDLGISGAKTATFQSAGLELGDQDTIRLDLTTTAVTGTTPSMTVTIETSKDNATWSTVAAFSAVTTVTSVRKVFSGCDRFVRANCAISGTTPSFTFTVTGEAV